MIEPQGYAERMAALLPAIFHRYDDENARHMTAELLEKLAAEDREKGPLRRFLELTGSQLDELHSLARSALDLHDPEKVDGSLLPLLAQWIGWPTDHRIGLREQRGEIRKAAYIHRTVGLVPTIEATVKRILGWESRTKEFAHNVLLSNRPPRLNLWLAEHRAGTWTLGDEPLSLNSAHEGRPAAAYDGDGTLWLFFHTRRKRSKVSWEASDAAATYRRRGQWDVWFKTFTPPDGDTGGWTPSRPLTDSPAVDKHPAAALQGDTLWVFWDTWSENAGVRSLGVRTLRDGTWSPRSTLWGDDGVERRRPQAVVDGDGRLWLFWQEKIYHVPLRGNAAGRWRVRYNRHDGAGWGLPADLRQPGDVDDPGVEEDLFVQVDASHLRVVWSRRHRSTGGRWRIAGRVLDLAAGSWEAVAALPEAGPEADDREPAVLVGASGDFELFWSSNRDGSWSIRRSVYDAVSRAWSAPEKLTGTPFSQRAPLAVADPSGGTLLVYYSDQSLAYTSATYGATTTVDGRYAGSVTADAHNAARNALYGSFGDCRAYTFDTGAGGQRGDATWYARDTVGLYVTPDTEDPSIVARQGRVVARVLRQFLPIQVRSVMILEPAIYRERIYTYPDPQHQIGEESFDTLDEGVVAESYTGTSDEHTDTVPGWVRIQSWSVATPSHRSVDVTAEPVDLSQRTWHVGLGPGE